MADTQRTLATLQGLLADNTTNDITAQDLRDCLVSAAPNAGQLYVTSSAATTVGSSGVYYEAAGTWALGAAARNFSRQADNRLRYDGAPTQLALVVAHFTLECGSSSQSCRVAITKNGSVVAGGDARVFLGTSGSAMGQGSLVALTTVATNDYLGLWVRNDTAANNLTLAFANLAVLGLLN